MFERIWVVLRRIQSIFSGKTDDKSPMEEIFSSPPHPVVLEQVSTTVDLVEEPESSQPQSVDLSRWTVSEHPQSPFAKVGRLYLRGDSLMIVSELDRRGFSVKVEDMGRVLDGNSAPVYLANGMGEVGTTKLSASGKGVNFKIDPFLYTTPVRSISRILEKRVRKGPLFVGREQVGG